MKRVLITGALGQDGTYLAESFLGESVEVYGYVRTTQISLRETIEQVRPHECYHLAAFHKSSQAGTDRDAPASEKRYLADLDSTHELLAAIREYAPLCRVFLAGSCHQFGQQYDKHGTPIMPPLDEMTPMRPQSMYGITKLAMMQMGNYFVGAHNIFVSTGILFNHESPRRGPSFITTRLARAAALGEKIEVGNLDAKVDWGFAGDYVKAMRLMLSDEVDPSIYVISSGELHTVREFAEIAYAHVERDYREFVTEEPMMHRPVSSGYFGDAGCIRALGWEPKTSFVELVKMMVDSAYGNS